MTDAKTCLIARRRELTGDLARIEHELHDPIWADWEDAASERQGYEVLKTLGAHDKTEIRAIDAALARIEDGSYGICIRCGSDISPKRLEALPTAAVCRACAS